MVYIRSYLVKRCNKKNDLRSFWRITQRKFIFLQIVYNNWYETHTLLYNNLLGSLLDLYANNENDSLLKVLDKVISERLVYTEKKEATIKELKAKKKEQKTLDDMYRLNSEILHQYETFVCDSAEQYINENIEIAKKLDNKTYLLEGGCNWLLFIPYRGCLFKLMIFQINQLFGFT